MRDCDPQEITVYEATRQRLRALAVEHPEILDPCIADAKRGCPYCHAQTCIEHPPDTYVCRSCGRGWTQATRYRGRAL